MPLEYLSGNELISYPFRDSVTVKATNGTILAKNVFADIIVSCHDEDIYSVSLTEIYTDDDGIFLEFTYSDSEGNTIGAIETEVVTASIATHKLFGYSNNAISIKLVLGSGFSAIHNLTLSFDKANTILAAAAVRLYGPKVTSISFYNQTTLIKTFTKDIDEGIDAALKCGSNTTMTSSGNSVILDVKPGTGAGLHNGCNDDLVIKTVNNIPADRFQNFHLLVDECYETEKGYEDTEWVDNYGITLVNTCKPRCISDQLGAFAHYLNRVRDGMETIAELAAEITDNISDMIDAYNSDVSRVVPFVKVAFTKFNNPYGRAYYSFVVSFFNKTDEDIAVSTTITSPEALVTGTGRFKQGTRTTPKTSLNITDTVPCRQQGRFEFITKGETDDTVIIEATAGVTSFAHTYTLP